MKIIKVCVDGVLLRIRQSSDQVALCDTAQYGSFLISHRLTTRNVVDLVRQRRYMCHMCMDCGCIMETPNVLHTCGNCD